MAVGPTAWHERVRRLVLWLIERERLPEPPAPARRAPGFLRWLFAPEALPPPAENESPRHVPVFTWLFRREPLPSTSKEREP
ncbi:MAG: hypothetical protein ACRDGR_03735 [bacterium]